MRIVLDTCVLVAALKSRNGASYALLEQVMAGQFEIAVSVPLVMEYEEVLARQLDWSDKASSVGEFVDALCALARRQKIFFLWRPHLKDSGDDMVLEVAVAAEAGVIVTHNLRDFSGSAAFGIAALSPAQLLMTLRGEP